MCAPRGGPRVAWRPNPFRGHYPRAHKPANFSQQPALGHIMRGVVPNVYLDNRDVLEALRFAPHLTETP